MTVAEICDGGLDDELYDKKSTSPSEDPESFKGNHLPVARVKKIMKEGEHQGMISSDAPVILAKACEMLIRDLTLQSWDCTQLTKRCTLQRQDITSAIFKSSIYNFLYDLLNPEDLKPVMETPKVLDKNMSLNGNLGNPQLVFNNLSQTYTHQNDLHLTLQRNKSPHPYADFRQSQPSQNYLKHDLCTSGSQAFSSLSDTSFHSSTDLNYFQHPQYGFNPNQYFIDQSINSSQSYNRMTSQDEKCESFQGFGHN